MGTVISTTGVGKIGDDINWNVTETVTPAVIGDGNAGIGGGNALVHRKPTTDLVLGQKVTVANSLLGETDGRVTDVSGNTPLSAALTFDSVLGRFISGRTRIPGVKSGLPSAVMDMVTQMAGHRQCRDAAPRTKYWSLAGHEAGFDENGKLVFPTGKTRTIRRINPYHFDGTEMVQFEEVSDLVTGFWERNPAPFIEPSRLLLPTPKIGTARTYIKFGLAGSSGSASFRVELGPNYRHNTTSGEMLSGGNVVDVIYDGVTDDLTVRVTFRNTSGASTSSTASGSVGALSKLDRVLLIELYVRTDGAVVVRAGVRTTSAEAAPVTAATLPVSNISGALYAGRMSVKGSSTAVRFKDLVIRETGIAQDVWAEMFTANYMNPQGFEAWDYPSIYGQAGPAPIPGCEMELWEYVKQVCAARGCRVFADAGTITLSHRRGGELDLGNNANAQIAYSNAAAGRNVVIKCQGVPTTSIDENPVRLLGDEDAGVYSVDVGKTVTVNLKVPAGTDYIYSPHPVANKWAPFTPPSIAEKAGSPYTFGVYSVVAKDNLPVPPLEWLHFGGLVTAELKPDGSAELTLRGPVKEIPGVPGPFRLAVSDGQVDRGQLQIFGTGIMSKPFSVSLPTGANPASTNVEVAAEIDNVAVGDMQSVYDQGVWAASRAAGPVLTLTATVPALTIRHFGVAPGAMVRFEHNRFRVEQVEWTGATSARITASKMVTVADVQGAWADAAGRGYKADALMTWLPGANLEQFATRPLFVRDDW